MKYNHIEIEQKWQKYWKDNNSFKTTEDENKKNFYALDMFPFPSGSGLHVGHPEGYTATDIIARMKRMQGYNVMHPMGWDAFGLPAEQYALKTKNSPKEFTYKNIEVFKKQINSLGFSYDWEKELATCDPSYYKWTQWIFSQLYKNDLAELKDISVNWCEELGTVLANDEIIQIDGIRVSERGNHPVETKFMKQWILKITKYADRLLDDLELVEWPENLKEMQRNWIGKSIGAEIKFSTEINEDINVFTTRCDTLFGCTYLVLAPENKLVKKLTKEQNKEDVNNYIKQTLNKSEIDRSKNSKTGVFTGSYCTHPITKEKLPIWISDYVLLGYGSGAVMAVPAHDSRDFEFATKFNLPIKYVIECNEKEAFLKDGIHINSDFLNGLNIKDSINKMIEFLEQNNLGKKKTNYKLRDWVFSRQRYWGEPFPVVHFDDEIHIIDVQKEDVLLPDIKSLENSKTSESPLGNETEWLKYTLNDKIGRRETNTMPQTAGSAWYYIGYILKNKDKLIDLNSEEAKEKISKWLPVDIYIGGAEHAVSHLLYARFWHKFLYDLKIVNTKEPFMKLFNQGMILGPDNQKMSKSKGNVINPDDIIETHGADTLRLYEMFMGPLEQEKPWSEKGLDGSRKFLERVFRLFTEIVEFVEYTNELDELDKLHNETIKKVEEDYSKLAFNTAISQMMIFINEVYKMKKITKKQTLEFLILLNPICPHLTEEINILIGNNESLVYQSFPTYDKEKLVKKEVTIIVQVNGKLRDKLIFNFNESKETIEKITLESEKVKGLIQDKTIVKVIVVPNKLINIVVK